jgi:hypothetical protein
MYLMASTHLHAYVQAHLSALPRLWLGGEWVVLLTAIAVRAVWQLAQGGDRAAPPARGGRRGAAREHVVEHRGHVLCLRVLEGDEVRDLGAAAVKTATYRVAVGIKTAGMRW